MITRLSKQALLVTAALLAFSFSACTSGDDDDSTNSDTSNQQQQGNEQQQQQGNDQQQGDNSGNQQQAAVVLTDATAAQAVSAIQSATGAVRISTGALTEDDLFSLADALKANTSARVTLDLSKSSIIDFRWKWQFANCTSLVSVVLPETLIHLGGRGFLNCINLESVTIPVSLTAQGAGAGEFGNCPKLTTFVIADGNEVFSAKDGMLFMTTTNGTTTDVALVAYPSAKGAVTVPSNVTQLYKWAFYANDKVTEITIPENVTLFGSKAIHSCPNLTAVHLPAAIAFSTSAGLPIATFYNCPNLTTITIAEESEHYTVRDGKLYYTYANADDETEQITALIGWPSASGDIEVEDGVTYAYLGGTAVTRVTLPESITNIIGSAFQDCDKLTSVTMRGTISSIGQYAFQGCTALTAIDLPENISIIDCATFDNSGLQSVTIPKNVTSVDYSAFSYCSALTTVRVEAATPPSLNNHYYYVYTPFEGCTALTHIEVPASSVASYKAAEGWSALADKIVGYSD